MTTPAAEKLYLAQHQHRMEGRGYAVYNPNSKPVEELPFVIGFNNGGSRGWLSAQLIAEDGTGLGGHICSDEAYMEHDLGILEGTRPDRHEAFREHYPDGYRMDFVPYDKVESDERLTRAFVLNAELQKAAESEKASSVVLETESDSASDSPKPDSLTSTPSSSTREGAATLRDETHAANVNADHQTPQNTQI